MTQQTATKWIIDPNHSQVQFKVKHLAITNVAGSFKLFSGEVQSASENFNDAKVQCAIDAGSLDTNNGKRDEDLRSPGFLDTQKFPKILFEGTIKDGHELLGELIIRDTMQPVRMALTFNGTGTGRFNDTRAGFEAHGKISRKDFGLAWDILTEAGGLIIGDEIKLHLDIQLIKQ